MREKQPKPKARRRTKGPCQVVVPRQITKAKPKARERKPAKAKPAKAKANRRAKWMEIHTHRLRTSSNGLADEVEHVAGVADGEEDQVEDRRSRRRNGRRQTVRAYHPRCGH